ncbi:MAG TPA: DUF559 domain-containing protein [Polyangiaceae bacterium]|nr:DUF559 domain-containing protein [Polyangiaceae bacterium]
MVVSVGDRTYRIDYAITAGVKIAVELDGFEFHGDHFAFTYDRLRQNDLQALGFVVIRFTYAAIRNDTARCVGQLQAVLRSDPELAKLVVDSPLVEQPDDMPTDPSSSLKPSPRRWGGPSTAHADSGGPEEASYFEQLQGKINRETLRECQLQAFSALANYYSSGGTKAACLMSVGAGKTALGVTSVLAFTRKRAMIVTPGNVIKGTFAKALDHGEPRNVLYGLPKGPLIPGSPPPRVAVLDRESEAISRIQRHSLLAADVIVTNFHSLGFAENPDDLLSKLQRDDIDYIVVDEAHIAASESYQRLFRHFDAARTLLLSACFKRLDGKPIKADVVYRYRLIDSIAEGNAKNIRLHRFAPDEESTVYELVWPDGFREEICGREAILELLKDERRLANVTARSHEPIRQVMRATKKLLDDQARLLNPVKPRVLFSALGQKHAEQIARIATECGIPTDSLHHSMTDSRIRSVKERFESPSGDLQGVVQLKMLGQGYDFPPITIVVPFRPYGSFSEFYQFIGRGVRVIRHPALQGRIQHSDQCLDIVFHADLNLDEHIHVIYEENDMDPAEVHEVPLSWSGTKDTSEEIKLVTGGRSIAEKPDAHVLFQPGVIEARMVHDDERVESVRVEREQQALAQRYAAYAQSTENPVSFEQYTEVIKQLQGET